jgi:hypothetical protein
MVGYKLPHLAVFGSISAGFREPGSSFHSSLAMALAKFVVRDSGHASQWAPPTWAYDSYICLKIRPIIRRTFTLPA